MKTKKILSAILSGIMITGSAGAFTVNAGAAGDVAINETNFPDPIFREYVSTNFDSDHNNVLSVSECYGVSGIDIKDTECASLKGIEHFPYMDKLIFFNGKITSIDVSKNTELRWLSLDGVPISTLDVSKNVNLTLLGCDHTNITELDVSKNINLETLSCDYNNLTSLDLSKNTALRNLECSHNKLTSLDLSKNPRLYSLLCENNQLYSLDLSKNPLLHTLWCGNNKLTSLDLSKNTALEGITTTMNYNELNIGEDTTEFDLTKLEKFGFDITKASNWDGCTLEGKTIKRIMLRATYTYNTGLKPVTFCLYCRDPSDISSTGDITGSDPDDEPQGDTVWVNGKDVKDKTDASKSVFYKTMTYQCVGKFSGGKWCVAVTSSNIDTTGKFVALFDSKGKISKSETDKTKNVAKAKLKDGYVTVTAGKEAGNINVWVYELKKDPKTKTPL